MTVQDLQELSEVDLITALYNKGIDLHYIQASYYALGEMQGHWQDEAEGYSEDGLHGRNPTR